MLDIITLLVSSVLASILFAAAQGLVWTAHRDERSLLWWSAANLANAGGVALFLIYAGQPTLFCIIVANTLILGGIALFIAGARAFNGKDLGLRLLAAMVAGTIFLLVALYFTVDRQLDRIVVVSIAIALGCVAIACEVSREEALVTNFARRLATGFFIGCAVLFVGRGCAAIAGIFFESVSAQMVFDVAFLASFILLSGANFCFLFMVFERIALEDELAKVNSRRGFELRGSILVRRAIAKRQPLTAVLFDLDQFKAINDTLGHQVGDDVIREFADLLRSSLGRRALIGRYGGDEFCIILPGYDRAKAFAVAEDIRRMCATNLGNAYNIAAPITVTIGLAVLQSDMKTLSDLLAAADAGLYHAKSGGRNRIGTVTWRHPPVAGQHYARFKSAS